MTQTVVKTLGCLMQIWPQIAEDRENSMPMDVDDRTLTIRLDDIMNSTMIVRATTAGSTSFRQYKSGVSST